MKKLKKAYYIESTEKRERLRNDGNTIVSREEVEQCDDQYYVNDRLVGINKKDFEDAAYGNGDLFTSISTTGIGFLQKRKEWYNDYVTIVYTDIDDATPETIVEKNTARRKRVAS